MAIAVRSLGQAGFRLELGEAVVYLDPYLSDSVEESEGPRFRRLVPRPMAPEQIDDADFVLLTHAHMDHCDPGTLPQLAEASPLARFLGPAEVREALLDFGVDAGRILVPAEKWQALTPELRVYPVPAAHPELERDREGGARCLGFVLDYVGNRDAGNRDAGNRDERRIYHAGDTSPCHELIRVLRSLRPLHVGLIPVNECSFFKERLGIVGNMTLREAFLLAEEIGVETLVPIHWDMFAPNSVSREEIELLYGELAPPFELSIDPVEL
ncbi:MAG: MBL fold metallo-hydrolase [Deltaproteobacteria bacterium]|nr:MBL fold metallo-hydrolase [Deltaproteobacteria bacterium]